MKKPTNLFAIVILSLLASAVTFSSCDKDEDEDENENQSAIVIAGNTLDLTHGTLEYYGDWGSSHNFDITLMSSSLVMDTTGDVTGTGDAIYFESFTATDQLEAGTYTYASDYAPGTFDIGSIFVNYNIGTDQLDKYYMATGGSYSISMDGNAYSITFNLQAREADWDTEEFISEQVVTLTGTFNGALVYDDVSGKSNQKKSIVFKK